MKQMSSKINHKGTHKTKRLILRPLTLRDFTSWHKSTSERNPPKNKFDSGPPDLKNITLSAYKKRLRRMSIQSKQDRIYFYSLFDLKTGAHIGAIDFFIFSRQGFNWANLGYQVHNQFAGNGYAKEAAKAAIQIGFKNLDLFRIEAAMEIDHKASQAVARAAGMKKECVRKQFLPSDNGSRSDAIVYAINRK